MMHDDQVHIDAKIVRGMIFDQFPEYRQVPEKKEPQPARLPGNLPL